MKTTTLLAAAAALIIGAALSGAELAHAQQLGTGSNALGSGGAVLGRANVPTVEDQQDVAPAALGECVTNRTAFRTQTNVVTTTSIGYVLMPNTHFPVTTSGGCLIVDFAATVASASAGNGMIIRAFIAGIGAAEPPGVFLGFPVVVGQFETRSMRFVFPNVPAGQHVVRIEYGSSDGGMVDAQYRTLTVQYRP